MSLPTHHPQMDIVLDILGVCVLKDRLQRDEELVEFCSSAQRLSRLVDTNLVYARRDLNAWFEANKARLKEIVEDPDATRQMLETIIDPELRRQTLVAVFAICVCDYHLADEESEYIQLALEVWKPMSLSTDCLEVLA
jgi:N-glycosylase/DNA lyase